MYFDASNNFSNTRVFNFLFYFLVKNNNFNRFNRFYVKRKIFYPIPLLPFVVQSNQINYETNSPKVKLLLLFLNILNFYFTNEHTTNIDGYPLNVVIFIYIYINVCIYQKEYPC